MSSSHGKSNLYRTLHIVHCILYSMILYEIDIPRKIHNGLGLKKFGKGEFKLRYEM